MKYDPDKHHPTGTLRSRRSIRLKGYDYSQVGAYYITIVTQQRLCLFGDVVNHEMQWNDAGQMVLTQWDSLPQRFPKIELDEFIVMPNHFHGIVVITDKTNRATTRVAPTNGTNVGAPLVGAQSDDGDNHAPALGEIVGAWKSIVTDEYIRGVHQLGWQPFYRKLWQRNYWEHIIRDEKELDRIRAYIINNPANWDADEENPKYNDAREKRGRR